MKNKPYALLLHPAFLLSLVFLLINDQYLKYQFHNGITGKLSDFAGLFSFAVFLSVFFFPYKKTVLLLAGLFFVWWKSPLSDSLISLFNNEFGLPVHRVIDYTDLLALSVLPLTILIKPVNYSPSFARQIAIGCVSIISLISFSATSMIRNLADDNRVSLDQNIKTKKSQADIVNTLKKEGLKPEPTTIYEKEWDRYYRDYYLRPKEATNDSQMIPVDSLYTGLYHKITYGTSYLIPKVYVNGDSIENLQMTVYNLNDRKNRIILHSFQYSPVTDSINFSSHWVYKKFKKPLKKKFRKMMKE